MNADIQDENTGMRALGERHGFVVVQPSANKIDGQHIPVPIVRHINLSLTSWQPTDYPIVWSIVQTIREHKRLVIDAGRVHFMGFSQGSEMTWHMLAAHPSEIASAVPMSCSAEDPRAVAAAAGSVPIMYSQGYADGLCPFEAANASVSVIKSAWGMTNGTVISQDEHHVRTAYRGQRGQILDTLFWDYHSEPSICGAIYEKIGQGHCFPGGYDMRCIEWDHLHYKTNTSFPSKLSPFSCPAPDPSQAAFRVGEEAVHWFLQHHNGKH